MIYENSLFYNNYWFIYMNCIIAKLIHFSSYLILHYNLNVNNKNKINSRNRDVWDKLSHFLPVNSRVK